MKQRVAFYTLGCKLNFSETSAIGQQFERAGFQPVPFREEADVYVINTCSVTENADKKCRKTVKQARKNNPAAFIAVVGCYAQLKPKEIAAIKGVDAVLGAADKFRLLDIVQDFSRKPEHTIVQHCDVAAAEDFIPTFSVEERTRSFLKVQDGCNYNCSFCTIPLARGKSRSDRLENVIENSYKLAAAGAKEIVLTGINLGDYGADQPYDFLELVNALEQTPNGIARYRISSIEPNLLSDEIIETVAQSRRFMPHFHIPLQSGSNTVLGWMRRRYRRELYADRVAKIRELMPDCAIGVDVIVGFPGETEALFDETYRFLADLPVTYFHVFPYSARSNTVAATMQGHLSEEVKKERAQRLRQLSNRKRRAFAQAYLGTQREVLWEASNKNGYIAGWTDNYISVRQPWNPAYVNRLQQVRLTELKGLYQVLVQPVAAGVPFQASS